MELLYIAIAVLILLIVALVVFKKRQTTYNDNDDSQEDSIETLEAPTQVPAPNPLAQVDAFINEQRYGDAINELKRFLMSNPKNTDAMLKLLQVYGLANDHRAFNRLHQKIHEIADPDTIKQADFCRALLEDEPSPKVDAFKPAQKDLDVGTKSPDALVFDPSPAQEPEVTPTAFDEPMLDDFDLTLDASNSFDQTSTKSQQPSSDFDKGFDFDDFGTSLDDLDTNKPANVSENKDFDEDLNAQFDADFGTLDLDTQDKADSPSTDSLDNDGFDLSSDFDVSFDTPAPAPSVDKTPNDGLDFGDFDFNPSTAQTDSPSLDISGDKTDSFDFDFDLSPAQSPDSTTNDFDKGFDTTFDTDKEFNANTTNNTEPAVEFDDFSSASQLDELSLDGGFDITEDTKGTTVNDDFGFELDSPKFDEPSFDTPKFDEPKFDESAFDTADFDKPKLNESKFDEPKFDNDDFDLSSDFDAPAFDTPKFDEPKFDEPTFDEPKLDTSSQTKPSIDFGEFDDKLGDFDFDEPKSTLDDVSFDTKAPSDDGLSLDEFGFDPSPVSSTKNNFDFDGKTDDNLSSHLVSELDNTPNSTLDFGDLGADLDTTPSTQNDDLSLAEFGFDAPSPEPVPERSSVQVSISNKPSITIAPFVVQIPSNNSNTPDNLAVTLELAQAYLGLGEHESARHLLEEVLAKGNPDEQQSANALLARIA